MRELKEVGRTDKKPGGSRNLGPRFTASGSGGQWVRPALRENARTGVAGTLCTDKAGAQLHGIYVNIRTTSCNEVW